jgi:hydroxymethylglutaryl-CoA synthase
MIGIVSYGFYVPKYRVTTQEISQVWQKQGLNIEKSLNVKEKTVGAVDEDSLTMGYESAAQCLNAYPAQLDQIKIVFFGSETPVYAVNPTSTILAEFLGIEGNYLALDTQFACKAATGAMMAATGLIEAGRSPFALITSSDKATGRPNDALEFTAASGSVSFLLGQDDLILEIVDMESYSSDTPDFWRNSGSKYPTHAGRFTGKPAYFNHIRQASQTLLEKTKFKPADFAHAVFHQPNGKFPGQVAAELGFNKDQIKHSLVTPMLGNSYSASALMGLASTLEAAQPGELIFFCSYGSGAGSDAFVFRVTDNILDRRHKFQAQTQQKEYLDYFTYRQFMETA